MDLNLKRRLLNGIIRDDEMESYINEFGNIIKDLFPDGIIFPSDPLYNSIKDPFIKLFKLNEISTKRNTPFTILKPTFITLS